MKLLSFICLFLFSFTLLAQSECTRADNASLWVENYTCTDNSSAQIGRELFNESLHYQGLSSYAEVDHQPNLQHLQQRLELQERGRK